MKKQSGKKKKWMKFRHRIVRNLAWLVIYPFSRLKYGIKIDKFKEQGKRNYLVLSNHQTAFDQFFLGMAFKGPVYYMASEDLFSKGITSWLIKTLVAPIPIKKSSVDIQAVLDCKRVAREGGTIAIFPEGNRTFSGKTESIKPSIASLVKSLKLPLALYHIEGGFGVMPRFSDKSRGRGIHGFVHRVVEPEEYLKMSDDELYSLIKSELYVDDAALGKEFKSRHSAQYLERAMYYCPRCGFSEWESHGNTIECKGCGMRVKYLPNLTLEGIDTEFPYKTVSQWYDAQAKFISGTQLDLKYESEPLYRDTVSLYSVIPYKARKRLSSKAVLSLYSNRYTLEYNGEVKEYYFEKISSTTVLGKNKLNLYIDADILQIKGDKRFNPLKYMHLYFHTRAEMKGEGNGKLQFLGL